jgi:hypothetical protein
LAKNAEKSLFFPHLSHALSLRFFQKDFPIIGCFRGKVNHFTGENCGKKGEKGPKKGTEKKS